MYSLRRLMRGWLAAAYFGVDLGDVEDVDVDAVLAEQVGGANAAPALVVVAGDDLRRLSRKFGNVPERHIWASRA